MRATTLVLGVAVSALMLIGAGVLNSMAGIHGERHYRECIDIIRQIQALSSSWSIEIARVRANPLSDFDALTAFSPEMRRLKTALRETAGLLDLSEPLATNIDLYASAIDAKQKHTERFKTRYAVLRNSTRYLPIAATQFTHRAIRMGDTSLVRIVSTLVREVNQYLATPSEQERVRLSAVLSNVHAVSTEYSPALANGLIGLVKHIEVLLSGLEPLNAQFRQATSTDMLQWGNRLILNLESELARLSKTSAYHQRAALALLLTAIFLWPLLLMLHRRRTPASAPETGGRTMDVSDRGSGTIREAARAIEKPADWRTDRALVYDVLIPQIGHNMTSLSELALSNIANLRKAQKHIHNALRSTVGVLESQPGANLRSALDATTTMTTHLNQKIDAITAHARWLASFRVPPVPPHPEIDRALVNVNTCIDDAIAATGAEEIASVSRRYGQVPEITASLPELRLLLMQVLTNSVEAIGKLENRKGTIDISTTSTDDTLSIVIVDNGPGIPPERQQDLLKPLHVSRDGAMEVGLAVVAELVRKISGTIKVGSRHGRGTAVRIVIPTDSESTDPHLDEQGRSKSGGP